MRLRLLVALALPALLIFAACDDGGDEESTASPSATASDPTPTGDVEYCNDTAVNDVVDIWVGSVTTGLAKIEGLTLEDEDGMRSDIEAATRIYCEAGEAPFPEDVDAYCNAIIAAIDFRLDGPNDARNGFLTDYYDRCYQFDKAR